jgi:hypothetical protein
MFQQKVEPLLCRMLPNALCSETSAGTGEYHPPKLIYSEIGAGVAKKP